MKKEKNHIYLYKDRGEWKPFSLPEKYSVKWNNHCKLIALSRPYNPSPDYFDYVDFLQLIEKEENEKTNKNPTQ